ncbi:hypothetical protein [Vacuolonema iberomarrocanum]|uniref:hypothetical protein n=1 Tax=Vacuolonema iberomarrocanum TaxID=3454632 RepID=UPI0019F8ADFA|nr:sporulation/spore germination protein [filamentous cyanobacterium LEGE 07170]
MQRNHYKTVFTLLVTVGLLVGIGACRTEPTATTDPSNDLALPPAGETPEEPTAEEVPVPGPEGEDSAAAPADSGNLVTVTIYKADDQCVNFLPEDVQVEGDRPMMAAIGKVLEDQGSGDFDLSGYRVTVDEATGVATVDLRMNPGSARNLVSLSACEQFGLFGSLRETLVQNPEWNIQDVRFTEAGEDIVI